MGPLIWLGIKALRDPRVRKVLQEAGPEVANRAIEFAKKGRWRQLAILHAELVEDGSLLELPIGTATHWVVWSGEAPIAAYPEYDGDLRARVEGIDSARRLRPDEAKAISPVVRMSQQGAQLSGRLVREALPSLSNMRPRRRATGEIGAESLSAPRTSVQTDDILAHLRNMPAWSGAVGSLLDVAPKGEALEHVYIGRALSGDGAESLLGFFSTCVVAVSSSGQAAPPLPYGNVREVGVASTTEDGHPNVLILDGHSWRIGGSAPIVPMLKAFIDASRR